MNRKLSLALVASFALATPSAWSVTAKDVGQAAEVPVSNARGECMGVSSEDEDTSNSLAATPANSLRLLEITPAEGAKVRRSTILLIDLAYTLEDFEPEKFSVIVQFDAAHGRTTDGTFPSYLHLRSARGKVHYCFPLADVWDLPELQRPLVVHFYLNRDTEPGHSQVIAHTAPIAFATD